MLTLATKLITKTLTKVKKLTIPEELLVVHLALYKQVHGLWTQWKQQLELGGTLREPNNWNYL